jgi:hypothetical protein
MKSAQTENFVRDVQTAGTEPGKNNQVTGSLTDQSNHGQRKLLPDGRSNG